MAAIAHNTITADGVNVFYRQAGPSNAPVLLLLHGFPTNSLMFRNLIPLLAEKFNVIAPDLPGFGFTVVPDERKYKYTFDALSQTTLAFIDALNLKKYAIYIFDYGSPVGLRVAVARPEQVSAIISQNGNAYVEGLSEAWAPIQKYWVEQTPENRNNLRPFLTFNTTKWQYEHGTSTPSLIAPETYHLDAALLARPGNDEIQLDLFLDYQTNPKIYPSFHAYFKKHQPPTLLTWGKNDPFFVPAGAEAFKTDLPNAQIHFFDTGHFALETHYREIGAVILSFLASAKL
jgi:pimeloyl-ACP methyl ester carboxylesterase